MLSNDNKSQQQQQKALELCGGVVRGYTKLPALYFRGAHLYNNKQRVPLFACHIQSDLNKDSFVALRGVADSINLRYQFTDEALHHSLLPEPRLERFIFEMLEQLRVDSLVPLSYSGMRSNLLHRFEEWSLRYHHSELTQTHIGMLIYTIIQVSWSRFNNRPVIEETEDLIESTRAGISPLVSDSLYGMKKNLHDQAAFAEHALAMAIQFNKRILVESDEFDENNIVEDADKILEEIESSDFKLLLNFDENDDHVFAISSGESKSWLETDAVYKIFTTTYDKTLDAKTQVRSSLLKKYREVLDDKIQKQGLNVPRLARQLKFLFASPHQDDWNYAEEQGYIDGRRLSQLIASPTEKRIFKNYREQPQSDCVLSFLVDCSGSMKQHTINTAILLDVMARAADLAGIKTEILGFTTGLWSGGKPMKEWLAQGKPKNPGRLNETNHIIYKDAEHSWKQSRQAISALMKTDLYREGVDGEAINWAAERLLKRPEKNKILTVISDGSPMDSATNIANDPFYLDNHLKDVIGNYELNPELEIFGLGVELDLSVYYRNYTILHLQDNVNNVDYPNNNNNNENTGLSNATFNDIFGMWQSRLMRKRR
jgi:cobaltochelatase CobT